MDTHTHTHTDTQTHTHTHTHTQTHRHTHTHTHAHTHTQTHTHTHTYRHIHTHTHTHTVHRMLHYNYCGVKGYFNFKTLTVLKQAIYIIHSACSPVFSLNLYVCTDTAHVTSSLCVQLIFAAKNGPCWQTSTLHPKSSPAGEQ